MEKVYGSKLAIRTDLMKKLKIRANHLARKNLHSIEDKNKITLNEQGTSPLKREESAMGS